MSLVPLSRETHANLRLRPISSFEFARGTPLLRILAGEVSQVAPNFPIVFLKEGEAFAPFALMGLAQGENLFVSDDGKWLGFYVPALLRRYPFLFARQEGDGEGKAVLMVEDSMLSPDEGEALFDPTTDEPVGPVARAIQFLTDVEMSALQTAALVKSLADLDLMDLLPLQVTRSGSEPTPLEGIYIVNEAKLNGLSDEAFLALRRSGALAFAYAQIISLGQLARLQARATAKANNVATPFV
jgi:hypothetical protein